MNFILKYNLLPLSFILILNAAISQKTNIDFKINGLSNKSIIIAHYFGENTLINDTVNLDVLGKGTFKSDTLLPQGLYLCIYPDKSYFEFILDQDQKFSIETKTGENAQVYIENMKIKGSDINSLFIDYQKFMIERNIRSNDIRKQLKENPDQATLKAEMEQLNEEVKNRWDKIKKNYAGTFLSKMIIALEDVEVPEPPRDESGNITDSLFQYNYYKNHYFDHFDFTDQQLLYSPIYHRRLTYFFDKVVVGRPDSIITAADRLLKILPDDSDYFQYSLAYIFNKYAQSKYMGFDAVIVHLAENYYLNGKASWVSKEYLEKLEERVTKLKPNLIGSFAPKLDRAQSIDGFFYPLYDVKAKFTVVAFFEPSCGHCKTEIPELHEKVFRGLQQYDVQVYAFYTQSNKTEWEKFIETKGLHDWINVWDPNNFTDFRNKYDVYATPTVFLLDENKKIIAKRVDIKTIISIIKEKAK